MLWIIKNSSLFIIFPLQWDKEMKKENQLVFQKVMN